MAIRGGSAGGLTTLLVSLHGETFSAAVTYFGVVDLTALARDTHKFESRYLDGLVGPLPEAAEEYRTRSPITHAAKAHTPTLVLQGLEDPVVPPAQAEAIVAALDESRIPHAYVKFPGEAHGFRQAANQIRALEAELAFYAAVFGLQPADDLPTLDVRFAEALRQG
jgi:dipeptidyl aminopeptidase/acylaminoacyl peptidase